MKLENQHQRNISDFASNSIAYNYNPKNKEMDLAEKVRIFILEFILNKH